MPFIEGESLRDRLTHLKQLPVADAVRIASEVASALDYAHRHNVIHRDIKPENILLHDGRALVADFGIALAASKAGGTRMTETGMSLGTPHYMSPEQAMGEREIGPQSDVYALGAVTYEMLVGEPPFTGPTAQAIIAKVMTDEPAPLRRHRKTIPEHVEAAVLSALEKLPADRFATAREFAAALATPTYAGTTKQARIARGHVSSFRDPVVLGLAIITLAALVLAAILSRHPTPPTSLRPVRFLLGGTDSLAISDIPPWPAAISPDGSLLVYSTTEVGGGSILRLRRSDQLEAQAIPGTVNGVQPLFSPDGQWLAFEADGKEKKVRLDGTAPVTIATGGYKNGADWTTTGMLVVGSTGAVHGLSQVSVAGGELAAVTQPDTARGELNHLWPIALDDGRTVAFAIWYGALAKSELAMTSLEDGKVTRLGLKGIRPLAVLEGHLLYLQADGSVMAVPIDGPRRRLTGSPVPVLDPIHVAPVNNGNSTIFVSRGGALVTGLPYSSARLISIGRDGSTHPVLPAVRAFQFPRLSPDGRRLAVIVADQSGNDAWIVDLATGTFSRLTTAGAVNAVEWIGDGSRVVYAAKGTRMRSGVWTQSATTAAVPQMVFESPDLSPYAVFTPDGRTLVRNSLQFTWKIFRIPLDSLGSGQPFASSEGNDVAPRISPDGRWVALTSDESGTIEVFVRSFPDPTVKLQVSINGGTAPTWSRDGSRLYYASGTVVIEARLARTPSIQVISRDTAFTGLVAYQSFFRDANYAVTPDDQRLITPIPTSSTYRLVVVPNWLTEFRERLAAGRSGGER
jgi:serine/threonine-protein kinase